MDAESIGLSSGEWLTVDQGNSTTKLVTWRGSSGAPCVEERATIKHCDLLRGGLPATFTRSRFQGIALSSVAGESDLEALLRCLDGLGPIVRPSCGLALEVRHPETIGTDRLFAARGAVELVGSTEGALIVVDAGTALTVDCVRDGVFLGGAIAPGPLLLSEALAGGGALLFGVVPVPGVSALGRESREALEAGVVVGFRGAAKELVRCQLADAAMLGSSSYSVFLTGGARHFLMEPEPFVDAILRVEEDLVHRGLLASLWSELEQGRA